jgi:hypothetical protein
MMTEEEPLLQVAMTKGLLNRRWISKCESAKFRVFFCPILWFFTICKIRGFLPSAQLFDSCCSSLVDHWVIMII